jgi:hypothetical protein
MPYDTRRHKQAGECWTIQDYACALCVAQTVGHLGTHKQRQLPQETGTGKPRSSHYAAKQTSIAGTKIESQVVGQLHATTAQKKHARHI